MMDFQTMLQGLNVYWKAHGCALLQPYDSEVATGVLYPETFFRLLGPNPWQAAYAATARRPSDGRYGSNPYRLQHYFQYQVLLKPSVQDVQTRYLDSLKALDIDLRAHDLRFVEDTWELVNLGAWGLGWDVWLDGLSISRITYLQQLGGVALEPVTVKLSYGLARLAMHLQAAAHVYDVQYSPEHSLGDLYQVFEAQHSSYNFDHVDSSLQRELFERYEAEAMRLLELELVYPAYDFV
ncbi:MAG: glycine--tRNA ligase subunit alpha, partial [Deinococcota bacterium]